MAIFRKPRHTPSREIGLYIHIPFCAEKCMYCDFYSLPCGGMGDADMARLTDDYCDAVMLQLEDQAGIAGQCVVDSVYLGGGTPTMRSSRQLVDMLDCVCDNYKVASDAEITVEANPGTVEKFGKKGLMGLRRAGVSRVSMGMQSGDDAELTQSYSLNLYDKAKDTEKEITVTNERNKEKTITTTKKVAPKTGDETPMSTVGILVGVGVALIVVLQLVKRRLRTRA